MAYTAIADGDGATPDLFNTRFEALHDGNLDVLTTAGDMLYATAASTGARLAIGAANAVMTSTGSAPAWTAGLTNTHISASAEIAVSKLADGSARQLLQTDAAGTGVEWASNIDVPGTLDVTGAAVLDSTLTVVSDVSITGGSITLGAIRSFIWSARTQIKSSANGLLELFNNAGTDFTQLNFGGTSSSQPALKKSSAALICRLADDSAHAEFQAFDLWLTDGITAPSQVSGLAVIYVDTADGDLKVKFGDGITKTLATDT